MLSTLNYSLPNGPETKHQKMKQIVNAIEEYFRTKAEDTALTITKHLQSISVMIDLSIFDPHVKDTAQFYLSLHELMNKMEQQSPFTWYCVDVLSNACRNPAARKALIHTYQFIPSLSRLLGDQLTLERKLRLLKLMQDLSCGMEITWQIPHLAHLMKTLTKWVESENSEIIALSLGVLVNLCYKNLPAVYTLLGNVDVKQLLRVCTALEGPAVEVHTCKLLIILNYTDGDENILTKLIEKSFISIIQAFETRDLILMRQVVEFFVDASKENNSLNNVITGKYYEEQLLHLFEILENNEGMETDEIADGKEPECIALIFEFLHTLIKIKLPTIVQNYEFLIDVALKWINTELVSTQALWILTEIAQNLEQNENSILEPLAKSLPLFLNELKFERDAEMPIHVEHNKKIANLLQLLRALVRVGNVRPKIIEDLQPETVCKLFGPLLGDINSPGDQASVSGTGTVEAVNLYLQAIVLINELAEYDHRWTIVQKQMLEIKQIHMILVKALFEGAKETKTLVMSMFKLPVLPVEMISDMMVRLQPSTIVSDSKKIFLSPESLGGPILSPAQVQRLDNVLETFKTAIADKNIISIPTSNVMELYEYKLAAVGHAEATAVASIEAASERCTHLQHRLNQLTAEINRYHQLLLHSQHCQDQNSQVTEKLKNDNRDLLNKIQAAKGKYKACHSQLTASETALNNCRTDLEDTTKKLNEITDYKKQLEEQYNNLKQCVNKLEENATRLEKTVQRKDESLNKANQNIEQLHLKLNEWDAAMTRKEAELQRVTKESLARKEILDTITKVANSQRT